jgi:hypothetical protein
VDARAGLLLGPLLGPFLGLAALATAGAGCGRDAEIVALRDAIARNDAVAMVTRDAPTCHATSPGGHPPDACIAEIAKSFGAKKGFRVDPPDQASAATAALLVARDGHGEWVPAADAWLALVKTGKGAGVDALRLAMAEKIGESVGTLPHPLVMDNDARSLMRAVASSVPGACDAYALAGAGAGVDVASGAPDQTLERSPCVQKDLERPAGDRGKNWSGLWRGAEGALALWREAGGALRAGLPLADAEVKGALEAKLNALEVVLRKVDVAPLSMVQAAPAYDLVPDDPRAAAASRQGAPPAHGLAPRAPSAPPAPKPSR